jgi:hypothetical protein
VVIPIFPPERSESSPPPTRGEADARLRAAGGGPDLLKIPKVCGATGIRAAQRSLTLTLSPRGARELERTIPARPIPLTPFPEWKGGTEQKNHGVRSGPIPITPFPSGKGGQKVS